MSTLVALTRKAETVQGFQILAPSDMLTALQYIAPGGGLAGTGYTGRIEQQNQGTSGTVTWTLLITNPVTSTSSFASIGDWIILENNTLVTVARSSNFATLYSTS